MGRARSSLTQLGPSLVTYLIATRSDEEEAWAYDRKLIELNRRKYKG
jgi:hypothetical protein